MRAEVYSRKVNISELLIIAAVLVSVSVIAVPRISRSAQNAKQNICDSNVNAISLAIHKYASDNQGQYPSNHKELYTGVVENPKYFPDASPQCPFGGTYIIDPETNLVVCSH